MKMPTLKYFQVTLFLCGEVADQVIVEGAVNAYNASRDLLRGALEVPGMRERGARIEVAKVKVSHA